MEEYFIHRDGIRIYLEKDEAAAQLPTVPSHEGLRNICQRIAEQYTNGDVNALEHL